MRVAIVTPRASQAYDLVRRLVNYARDIDVQVLQTEDRTLPIDLDANPGIKRTVSKVRNLSSGPGVVIGTASKFVHSALDFRSGEFDILVCDEAYQLMYKDFMPLAKLATNICMIGDPGQLEPLLRAPADRFEAMQNKVHWPAPSEMRRRFADIPVVRLPVSMRLRQDTVDVIQPAMYPKLKFVSGANETERRVTFQVGSPDSTIDRALDLCSEGSASIAAILLPARRSMGGGPDEELAALMASVARRILDRGAEWEGRGRLAPADIGCLDPNVAACASVRAYLQQEGISTDELLTDTPERFQGLQRPVTIVRHPLSGKRRLSAFELSTGRWTVMLSRHMLFTIIVGRADIEETLLNHQQGSADRTLGAQNVEWQGWQAHMRIWRSLKRLKRIVLVE